MRKTTPRPPIYSSTIACKSCGNHEYYSGSGICVSCAKADPRLFNALGSRCSVTGFFYNTTGGWYPEEEELLAKLVAENKPLLYIVAVLDREYIYTARKRKLCIDKMNLNQSN